MVNAERGNAVMTAALETIAAFANEIFQRRMSRAAERISARQQLFPGAPRVRG
jgi:hypothetical protein